MTDPYNVFSGEDPQSNQIMGSYAEEEKKKDKKKKSTDLELYMEGRAVLERFNYTTELQKKDFLFYCPQPPEEIKGVTYPASFEPIRQITTLERLLSIQDKLSEFSTGTALKKFWAPAFGIMRGTESIYRTAKKYQRMQESQYQNMFHMGHSHDPMGKVFDDGRCFNPVTWIPDVSWFKDEVRENITFEDVFLIFPPAERQMLKLILGRIGVGMSGHKPPNNTTPIDHTSRMAGILVGESGLGKSTLFNKYFIDTITKLGFRSTTFRKLTVEFLSDKVISSHFCYKDDCVQESLKNFLKSEDAKILISNGSYEVAVKFDDPIVTHPSCVFLINANDWNPNISYELDSGIIDRTKIIKTLLPSEINRSKFELPSASLDSPNFEPKYHLPWLAEKYDVSVECLMAWAMRQAADCFYETIQPANDDKGRPINNLAKQVNFWSSRLRYNFPLHTEKAIIKAIILCHLIRNKNRKNYIPELTPFLFNRYIQDLFFICVDPSANRLFKYFKQDWEDHDRSTNHFYYGIRQIRYESLKDCVLQNFHLPKPIKEVFSTIQLRSGMKLGSGIAFIYSNWNDCRLEIESLVDKAEEFVKVLKPLEKEKVYDTTLVCDDYWLGLPEYSPDIAEKLRKPKSYYMNKQKTSKMKK